MLQEDVALGQGISYELGIILMSIDDNIDWDGSTPCNAALLGIRFAVVEDVGPEVDIKVSKYLSQSTCALMIQQSYIVTAALFVDRVDSGHRTLYLQFDDRLTCWNGFQCGT